MFERWTDIIAAVGLAAGLAYIMWEVARRQKQLREYFDVLDGDDAAITTSLEELVDSGRLRPYVAVPA